MTHLRSIKNSARAFVCRLPPRAGFVIRRLYDPKADLFPDYSREARKMGVDVNDYEEEVLGWERSLPILERTVFPRLRDDSRVCELGPGTGRFSRHIISRLPRGELHLVDHSPWMVSFTRKYFRGEPRVRVHWNDGQTLPFDEAGWVDLIFSNDCFVAMKLGSIYLYSREFYRVLKPGGVCVIDYIDPFTPGGWHHLETRSRGWGAFCYTYHARPVLEKVFQSAGFEVIDHCQIGKSSYLIARKAR